MVDSERKQKSQLDKRGPTIKCTLVCKRNELSCKLHIRDIKINQVHKSKYLSSEINEEGNKKNLEGHRNKKRYFLE